MGSWYLPDYSTHARARTHAHTHTHYILVRPYFNRCLETDGVHNRMEFIYGVTVKARVQSVYSGSSCCFVVTLLDLSSAFDTIDHSILLDRLEDWVGVTGMAHDWLRCLSRKVDLPFGVPQGSVLGPLLFTIYTTLLSQVVSQHDISRHFYADDSQLYVSFFSRNSAVSLSSFKVVLGLCSAMDVR